MISVTILTKNSSKYLKDVLAALTLFPEVLIYDTGSTDDTLTLAATFANVTVKQGTFDGFGATHNRASSLAKYAWILSIDSDEVATPALVHEILMLKLDPTCVYSVPRENLYQGKVIRGCGWQPDRQLRLYHRHHTQFNTAHVHEKVIVEGMREYSLQAPLRHYSYENMADFLTKMQLYSTLFAAQYAGSRSSSPLKACWHSFWAFIKSYLLKKGFRDGYEGFVISAYNAHTAFYKYLKLYEVNRSMSKTGRKIDF